MFLTETECERIAKRTADIVLAELRRDIHRSPNGNLMIEVVEVNTLPVSLRGGVAHD
ncbi:MULTISPECIES: hypothetical protein [Acetobacter]|uniref:Uncharacterized protein n=1 Tax=Acetobacter pasteurianus subsp. pasteurianus TaxID=481145 RepID=A0AAC9SLV3_ACEPA|nr:MULTISPECIES: hypothetical protein [Acetobacter]ASC05173.1 hypothetical protein S101468_00906 [Acetobacter pasteurianus subsp. pasteurianus]BCZ75855.1 hypothetical protein [Acetobacter phage phiAP1]CCT58493.1 hypothetical protein APA386B_375 [Acetobacter pasteurianus 386B]